MSGTGHPHVVFHRSAVKNGTDDDKKAPQKKRRKKRRRRHHSNCGTKEPRRSAEQKIEWQPQGKVNLIPGKLHKLGLPSFLKEVAEVWNGFGMHGSPIATYFVCFFRSYQDLNLPRNFFCHDTELRREIQNLITFEKKKLRTHVSLASSMICTPCHFLCLSFRLLLVIF